MSFLLDTVNSLLEDAGFSEELYIVHDEGYEVIVEVDEKEAATYILKIAEEEKYKKYMIVGQVGKKGKRHRITFILW